MSIVQSKTVFFIIIVFGEIKHSLFRSLLGEIKDSLFHNVFGVTKDGLLRSVFGADSVVHSVFKCSQRQSFS